MMKWVIILNIYGWDIVLVNTIDKVNLDLKKYIQKNEVTFDYKDENTSATLTFNNWEIIPGGASKLLRMKTLVKEGRLTYMGKDINLDGICPLLEVQLSFVNSKQNPDIKKLNFSFLVQGEYEGDQKNGAVTIINPDMNNIIQPGSISYQILKIILPLMFIQNKAKISYVFAELNTSSTIPWMQPEKFKYSYFSPAITNSKGFLVIFSVVTNREITELDELIDGKVLDNENSEFTLISEGLFLENVIMPELPGTFGNGATTNHFFFESTSHTTGMIKNNMDLKCDRVKSGLIWYYPKITSLNIKVESDRLLMNGNGKCPIEGIPGGYINFDFKVNNQFFYNQTNKSIEFISNSSPKVTTKLDIPWWVWLNPIWGGIIHIIASDIASSIAKYLKMRTNTFIGNLSSDLVNWGKIDDKEINDCILDVILCIKK